MNTSDLREIRDPETRRRIIEITGSERPATPNGLFCPNCDAREVYASPSDPDNTRKWVWMIRAFRVDTSSECCNCKRWFDL